MQLSLVSIMIILVENHLKDSEFTPGMLVHVCIITDHTPSITPDLPIDVVYTWVNGSDPILVSGLKRLKDKQLKQEKEKELANTDHPLPSLLVSLSILSHTRAKKKDTTINTANRYTLYWYMYMYMYHYIKCTCINLC